MDLSIHLTFLSQTFPLYSYSLCVLLILMLIISYYNTAQRHVTPTLQPDDVHIMHTLTHKHRQTHTHTHRWVR